MKEKYQVNNIVKIGSRDKREIYIYSILIRMQPHIYDKKEHKCIIIQVQDSLLEFSETIFKLFKWAGLIEFSRKRKKLKNELEGYDLPNAWEIIFKKIPVLEMQSDDGD